MPDGRKLQRDLYSVFLLQYTNKSLDGFDQALLEQNYSNFVSLHDREIQRIRGKHVPSSFGVAKKSIQRHGLRPTAALREGCFLCSDNISGKRNNQMDSWDMRRPVLLLAYLPY